MKQSCVYLCITFEFDTYNQAMGGSSQHRKTGYTFIDKQPQPEDVGSER